MFNFGNIFSSLLSGPVGNGMPSEADDVKKTRRNFASIGRYDGDTGLGYIDRKLDDTIRGFQRDEGLKIDGVMKPGGETERALHRTLEKKKSGLFGSGFGERPEEREDNPLTLSLVDSVGNNKTNRPDDVKQVQRGLSRIGMAPRSRLFEPSGVIDTETTDAVKALQKKQDLKVDGYLNPSGETERTINTLLSSVKTGEDGQTSGAEDAKPVPKEEPEKPKETPKPEEKKKEESKCNDLQKKVEHLKADVGKLKDEVKTSENKAQQAVDVVNDSVHRAQVELARIGLKTIIERVPGIIGFLAKLIKEPGTKGTRQEAETRFKAISAEHALLRQNAEHAGQTVLLTKAKLSTAKAKLAEAKMEKKKCEQAEN